jgi:DeoR/GlpR family transcriptional regulator of sugar metabolism
MANLVESSGFTRVTELAEHFAASTVTVRSGLAALEAYGRRRRVHGGMPPVSLGVAEKPLELTASEQAAEKLSISTQAAALVSTATS